MGTFRYRRQGLAGGDVLRKRLRELSQRRPRFGSRLLPLGPVDTDARWRTSRPGKSPGLNYQDSAIVNLGGFILSRGVTHASEGLWWDGTACRNSSTRWGISCVGLDTGQVAGGHLGSHGGGTGGCRWIGVVRR